MGICLKMGILATITIFGALRCR